MKDKRNIIKLACILEGIYIISMMIYCLFFRKMNDEVMANLFMLIISTIVTIMLYKESKKDIKVLKENKLKILMGSIWLFLEPVIPGILGFIFLSQISDKKKINIPVIKEKDVTKKDFYKSLLLVVFFILVMFVFPNYSFFNKIPLYLVYITIFSAVFIMNFKEIKDNFLIFINNLKLYLPFIIKRYFIMLGVMIIVAMPIVLLNNGQASSNQQVLNAMFKKLPMVTVILSCLYAPFVEEGVFRLSLSKIFKNKTIFVIASGFLFGALHLIDKFTSIYDLLYIFQYAALGICLAKAYKDSNNIFVSISMHFIQNFIAAMLILILY